MCIRDSLNIIEGFTSPVYQNGLIPFLKTVPKAILATFNKEFGQEAGRKWISNKQLGLDNYMGEVQAATKKLLMILWIQQGMHDSLLFLVGW